MPDQSAPQIRLLRAAYSAFDARDIDAALAIMTPAVEVHRDSPAGPILGGCSLPGTGGWNSYETTALPLKNDAGKLDLYLIFHGSGGDLAHFTWLAFK